MIGTEWCISAYNALTYDGERKLSKQIVEGIAKCVTIPNGGFELDVRCGSDALTIASAKNNSNAKMLELIYGVKSIMHLANLCARKMQKRKMFLILNLKKEML